MLDTESVGVSFGAMTRTRFDTECGRRVTRLLVDACSTQRRLARLLGVPHSTLNQMITGRLPPWPDLEARARLVLASGHARLGFTSPGGGGKTV